MYSVVLMAALSTGSASPDSCFTNFCNLCGGNCGNPAYNNGDFSYGRGYDGYVSRYSPYGGYGQPYFGGYYDGYGIAGYYVGTAGCYGGAFVGYYGGSAGMTSSGGFGYSGYYPGIGYGGQRNDGNYGGFIPVPLYSGFPIDGGYGYGGVVDPYAPVMPGVPVAPGTPAAPIKGPDGKTEVLPVPKTSADPSQAKVIIEVPAQTSLYIDGQLMPARSGKRTFFTPALKPNQTYFYDVKLVSVQDGKEKVQTTRVILHPGEEVAANFSAPTSGIVTVSVTPRP